MGTPFCLLISYQSHSAAIIQTNYSTEASAIIDFIKLLHRYHGFEFKPRLVALSGNFVGVQCGSCIDALLHSH